jgi:TM2 domain-containing membrane protein YozV
MNPIHHVCLRVFLVLLLNVPVCAQTTETEENVRFLNYLMESKQFDDAIFLSRQLISQPAYKNYAPAYYAGFAHYNLRQLDSAALYLGQVPQQSSFYIKSRFFQGISLAYLNKNTEATQVFSGITFPDSLLSELKAFEKSGMALLQKEYATFDTLSKQFTYRYYPYSKQESSLLDYRQQLLKVKRRSPIVAGLLSAALPGAGKVYAGQLGQGVAIFLQNSIFALQAWEGYRKDGPRSARFLIYSGLFTIFYIGNVWGSVLSVQIKRQEMYERINNQILFDMHIPLRTIFN